MYRCSFRASCTTASRRSIDGRYPQRDFIAATATRRKCRRSSPIIFCTPQARRAVRVVVPVVYQLRVQVVCSQSYALCIPKFCASREYQYCVMLNGAVALYQCRTQVTFGIVAPQQYYRSTAASANTCDRPLYATSTRRVSRSTQCAACLCTHTWVTNNAKRTIVQ